MFLTKNNIVTNSVGQTDVTKAIAMLSTFMAKPTKFCVLPFVENMFQIFFFKFYIFIEQEIVPFN